MTAAGDPRGLVGDSDAGPIHCEHAASCPGCSQLSLPAGERAARKRGRVQAALDRYRALATVGVGELIPAQPVLGYRTRAKLVVDGPRVGLYARGTHDVVDIPHCRVLAPVIARVLRVVRARSAEASTALLGVDLREVQGDADPGVLVTLIGPARDAAVLERIGQELARDPGVLGVALSARERTAPTLLGAVPRVIAGAHAVPDRLDPGSPYQLATHGSFAQAHRGQAAALGAHLTERLERALDGLSGRRVLELYAGSGALALRLCQRGAQTLANERFAPALELAREAAAAQAIAGLDIRAGDAAEVLDALLRSGERFDAVVVNPPRRGLPVRVREGLAALAPRAIAYVSCDPDTLARDLDHLAGLGYAGSAIDAYDMIPLSDSVECLALLAPHAPSPIPILYEDEDMIAVHKPPHLATTPQGERHDSLLARVREQLRLRDVTAVHRLDQGTSGVCLLAKAKGNVAALATALRDGEKQYLALARGITREKGSVNRPLADGPVRRAARTRYRRVAVAGGHSLLRVRPDQGRKHQVRRHLAAIGHPLLGDPRYGDAASNRHFELRHGLDRPFLHLESIELCHPRSGATLHLEAPLSGDLVTVRERLCNDSKMMAAW